MPGKKRDDDNIDAVSLKEIIVYVRKKGLWEYHDYSVSKSFICNEAVPVCV